MLGEVTMFVAASAGRRRPTGTSNARLGEHCDPCIVNRPRRFLGRAPEPASNGDESRWLSFPVARLQIRSDYSALEYAAGKAPSTVVRGLNSVQKCVEVSAQIIRSAA